MPKCLTFIAAIALFVMAVPATSSAQLPTNDLERALGDKFSNAGLGGDARFGAFIADATTGEHLAAINAREGMTPASMVKLFTTAAALDVLGPDHQFRTSVHMIGQMNEAGHLYGNLLIKGGGDPALGSRFQDDRLDVTRLLRLWARDLRAMGLKSIDGLVIGDERLFQGDTTARGWDPVELAEWWSAEVSALTFNDGCVSIQWDSNRRVGSDAAYTIIPATDYIQFTSSVKVAPEDTPYRPLRYFRHTTRNEQVARGNLPRGMKVLGWTAVQDPPRFTAQLLVEEMKAAKIKGEFRGVSSRGFPESRLPEESEMREVLSFTSPPLAAYLGDILGDSQNLYAECIARAIAIKVGEPATFEGAAAAITRWADGKRYVGAGFALADGSGLSGLNLLAPRSIADLLMAQRGDRAPDRLFRDALSTAGEGGTLARRLTNVQGRFSGKTGVLKDASSLAGYLRLSGGREFVVVLMIDGSSAPVSAREAFLDSVIEDLDRRLSPALTASR